MPGGETIYRRENEGEIVMRDHKKGGKEKETKRGLIVRTMILLAMCGIAAFVVLAVRLYRIQIEGNAYYEALALSNQLRESTLTASRGTIYDVNGKILAMSASVENVFISPLEIEKYEQDKIFIAGELSELLDVDRDVILDKMTKTESQYQIIKPGLESDKASQVRTLISSHKLKGVYLEPATKRYYPNDSLASQIIGFVGTDNSGLDGIEQSYNSLLTGVSGRTVTLTNARGVDMMFTDYEDHIDAQNGGNITLTIDSSIQYYVEKHLEQAIEDYDIQNGAMCIAMNPKTGAILAIANYPNYNPNDFLSLGEKEMEKLSYIEDEVEYREAMKNAQYLQWKNRALADAYEPGSVFKILTIAMALEEDVATTETVFNCSGSMAIPGRREDEPVHCWKRYGHGKQTLVQATQNSCNMMCVQLGLSLGAETFYKYIDAFGLFDKTGLDNSSEGRSLWWNQSVFFDSRNQSQLAVATFGQTFKVTPIQMITAVSAAINGGYLMQPYIVSQVTDGNGNIIDVTEPTIRRQVISNETSAVLRGILEEVVATGTGTNAQVKGYKVGGKTGTSENTEQIAANGGEKPAKKDYLVSFAGFAPADDPQIVILLLLDKPSHDTGISIAGGSMAAPVVGKMFADILPLCLGITPQYNDEDLKDINVIVPRYRWMGVDAAIEALTEKGFDYLVIGNGDTVTNQFPAQNLFVASGTTIKLYAGEDAPADVLVTVPQLKNLSFKAAKQMLESAGLFIRTTGAPKSDSKVRVSVQSIPSGTNVPFGSIVEVTLIDKDIIELRN